MKKEIYEYNGLLFEDADTLSEYITSLIASHYNNADASQTSEFLDEWDKTTVINADFRWGGRNGDFIAEITPIIRTFEIIAQTTLDKKHLNNLIKDLQKAVNDIYSGEDNG